MPARDAGPFAHWLERIAEGLAVLGGLVLLAIMLVQSGSVLGRSLPELLGIFGLKLPRLSIPGDIEIVQLGCAVAIFCFLPLCQFRRANVLVEFFTQKMPQRWRSGFDLAANLLFLLIGGTITWQLGHGTVEKFRYQDTTMVLRIPEAWPYLAALLAAGFWSLIIAYTCLRSAQEIAQNRAIGPSSAEH